MFADTDFVLNGRGQGPVGSTLESCRFDPGLLRPYIHNGVPMVTLKTGMVQNTQTGEYEPKYDAVPIRQLQDRGVGSPVFNSNMLLRKEEWVALDQKVVRAARFRLRAYADLAAANSYGGFNGMCLRGDTGVITRAGVSTLRELTNAGKEIDVLNRHGQWEKATAHSYGVQRLFRINFRHISPIYATAEHRWWMKDGKRITTLQLVGREIPYSEQVVTTVLKGGALVESIEDTGIDEEVFCLNVPGSESFALAGGLITSNSKMILEFQTMSDPGNAVVDMDGITPGQNNDTPQFDLRGLPLPITHSDFFMSSRMLAISRNSNTPLDTTMAEATARRVGETIEKTLIGVQTGVTYGGFSSYIGGYSKPSTTWGYTNFPDRLNVMTWYLPTGNGRLGTGWTGLDLVKDFMSVRQALYANRFYGPFMVYHSNDWDQYLDLDYIVSLSAAGGATQGVTTQTVRDRLRMIEGIEDVRRLDMMFATQLTGPGSFANTLYPFTMVFVQMTPDVVQAVNGMDITTVQWPEKGGMQLCFKVMCIQCAKLQSDFYGRCGICQATAKL